MRIILKSFARCIIIVWGSSSDFTGQSYAIASNQWKWDLFSDPGVLVIISVWSIGIDALINLFQSWAINMPYKKNGEWRKNHHFNWFQFWNETSRNIYWNLCNVKRWPLWNSNIEIDTNECEWVCVINCHFVRVYQFHSCQKWFA